MSLTSACLVQISFLQSACLAFYAAWAQAESLVLGIERVCQNNAMVTAYDNTAYRSVSQTQASSCSFCGPLEFMTHSSGRYVSCSVVLIGAWRQQQCTGREEEHPSDLSSVCPSYSSIFMSGDSYTRSEGSLTGRCRLFGHGSESCREAVEQS